MAELVALATAAASVVALAKSLAGSPKKEPLYTLTPPVFDRASHAAEENGLTLTPLERFAFPRSRLLSRHFTDPGCVLDARLHMAPPVAIDGGRVSHDFMARIRVPQSAAWGQPGAPRLGAGGMRPQATARFHLQHPECAHSFTDFVLKTEGGGSVFATGAYNLTAAKERFENGAAAPESEAAPGATPTQQQRGGVPVASPSAVAAASAAARRARSLAEGPRGLSAFFNLPLWGLGSQMRPPAQEVEGEGAERGSARSKLMLRSTPRIGLRWDDPTFSAGVHLDPQASLHQLRENHASQVQVGGWIAQETANFRVAAESVIAPLQRAVPGAVVAGPASAAPGVNAGVNGSAAASVLSPGHALAAAPAVGPGSLVPLSLSARLPLLVESRFGLFFRDSPLRSAAPSSSSATSPSSSVSVRPTIPTYEVGFSLLNRSPSGLGHKGTQEFTASYFHHLNVRRRIHNPLEEKQNRYVNNYIDLAMELVYRNDVPAAIAAAAPQAQAQEGAHAAAAAALAAAIPPALRLGASWQLNKNCLVKARLADDSLAALVAVKSWWDPSASLALSVQHGLGARGRTSVGVSFQLENVGQALFLRPDPAYRRMVASQKERIENLVEVDEDY